MSAGTEAPILARSSVERERRGPERLSPERLQKLRDDVEAFITLPGGERRLVAQLLPQVDPERNRAYIAPTGTGKTLALAPQLLLTEGEHRPRRVIIIEPTQGLCGDAAENLAHFYGEDITGHWYGGLDKERKRNPDANILVVTTGMAWNLYARGEIGPDDYVLFDEIHADMQHGVTEALIGCLNKDHDDGKRNLGSGFATATMPKPPNQGRGRKKDTGFLEWAGAETAEVSGETPHQSQLELSPHSVLQTAHEYLKATKDRNLLILCGRRREVLGAEEALRKLTSIGDPDQEYAGQGTEVFRYVSGDSSVGVNREIAEFMARNFTLPEDERQRLVILTTYGAMGSGVSKPVHDAIGTADHIEPVFEDAGVGTRVRSAPVEGTSLIQARGRIGRFCDGTMWLCYGGTKMKMPRDKDDLDMEPSPMPRPLNGNGFPEVALQMYAIGNDPRTVSWFSDVSTEQTEKIHASLLSRGLLEEGRLTGLAHRLRSNPLSRESIEFALTAETAPRQMQATVNLALATAGEDWRSLFTDDLTRRSSDRYDDQGREKVRVSCILEERGLSRTVIEDEEVDLIVPGSDVATFINVVWHMHRSNIKPQAVGMSPRAYTGAANRLKTMLSYIREQNMPLSLPLTADDWETVNRHLMMEGLGKRAQIYSHSGWTHGQVTSAGVVQDGFIEETIAEKGRVGRGVAAQTKWAFMLGPHTMEETEFTQLVAGYVPEELVPWIPENAAETLGPLYAQLNPRLYRDKAEVWEELAAYPHVQELITSFADIRHLTSRYHNMDTSVGVFDYKKWLANNLQSFLVRLQANELPQLEEALIQMADSPFSHLPQTEAILSSARRDEIEAHSPQEMTFAVEIEGQEQEVTLNIEYRDGRAYIAFSAEPPVPYQDGHFIWEKHFLYNLTPEQWGQIQGQLPARDGGYQLVWEGPGQASYLELEKMQEKGAYYAALRPEAAHHSGESFELTPGIDLDALLSRVGLAHIGNTPTEISLYLFTIPQITEGAMGKTVDLNPQAYIPEGRKTWEGLDNKMDKMRRDTTGAVEALFMLVHAEEVEQWILTAIGFLETENGKPLQSYELGRQKEELLKIITSHLKKDLERQLERVFPVRLGVQPPQGISVKATEERLQEMLADQVEVTGRIAGLQQALAEAENYRSLVPAQVDQMVMLADELRSLWINGEPVARWQHQQERFSNIRRYIEQHARSAQEAQQNWARDEQVLASRLQQLEGSVPNTYNLSRALESARHNRSQGNWGQVRGDVETAYSQVNQLEFGRHRKELQNTTLTIANQLRMPFTEGLRAVAPEQLQYVVYSDIRDDNVPRGRSGLAVWLSNSHDDEAARDRFTNQYLPRGGIASHPRGIDLEQLPPHLRESFSDFETGNFLLWSPIEVDGVLVATGCSVEAVYKEKAYSTGKMPDAGLWVADAEDIWFQLKRNFESSGIALDAPDYEAKLQEFADNWLERARGAELSSPDEFRASFTQTHEQIPSEIQALGKRAGLLAELNRIFDDYGGDLIPVELVRHGRVREMEAANRTYEGAMGLIAHAQGLAENRIQTGMHVISPLSEAGVSQMRQIENAILSAHRELEDLITRLLPSAREVYEQWRLKKPGHITRRVDDPIYHMGQTAERALEQLEECDWLQEVRDEQEQQRRQPATARPTSAVGSEMPPGPESVATVPVTSAQEMSAGGAISAENLPEDRLQVWGMLAELETADLTRVLAELKGQKMPRQTAVVRAAIASRGAETNDTTGLGVKEIRANLKTLDRLIRQANEEENSDAIASLTAAKETVEGLL